MSSDEDTRNPWLGLSGAKDMPSPVDSTAKPAVGESNCQDLWIGGLRGVSVGA